MPRRNLHRTALAIALAFLLTGAALALPLGPAPAPSGPARLLDLLESWLAAVFTDAGCIMDPDGRCAGSQVDAGGTMDPDG